ncbi:hypothetical protein E3Q08_02466 [Wallemia mellicola]|uniref:Zinc finger PHD-type domain-containing protein n=1 Tax=Wallemia mellicola TaxID=1708541 RepID=A0AB74KJV7_9BASI|nr:hypothetical protein E3Q12_01114 [Wallemia mellicola]TIC43162.1 hypothetical protein E3Q08_02466 [Wallemia mellicola]TIC69931.1 hypothetical protein E3Q03_01152 [Wallemia mellicola]
MDYSSDNEQEDEVLHCICKSNGLEGLPMILCEGSCETWYHLDCIGMEAGDDELVDVFVCKECEEKTGQKTSWRVKCQREGCTHASRLPVSVYCSDACGIYLMSLKLRQYNLHPDSIEMVKPLVINYNKLPWIVFDEENRQMTSLRQSIEYQLEKLSRKNDTIQASINKFSSNISLIEKQEKFLQTVINRANTLTNSLQSVNDTADQPTSKRGPKATKPKQSRGYCGFDYRLLMDDDEWIEFDIDSISDISPTDDQLLCILKDSQCNRHTGWKKLFEYKLQVNKSSFESKIMKLQNKFSNNNLIKRHLDIIR